MNSLLYYYNNVQKIAAYRQVKRMQRGVLTAQGGFSTTDPALLQMPCTIQCVFVAKEFRSERTQILFDTRGDSVGPRIDITTSNNLFVASNYTSISKPAILDKIYDVVFAVSKDSTDVYIDGEKEATLASGEAQMVHLNLGANSAIFYGDWLMYRQFNYLMSSDEVKAIDNNGNPMGYVVPKAMRYFPDVSFLGPDGGLIRQSYTWTNSPEDLNFFRYNFKQDILLGQRLKVQITVSDYEAGYVQLDAAFMGGYYGLKDGIRANGTYVFITNALNSTAYTSYGRAWCVDEGQGRKCTVTVDSVEVVGLLAEYLPQNLMFGRDDKTIATSWLDSAKQLPLSDEYMEPLFQSIGGYDMAANGAPEILYYGPKPDSKGVTLSLSPLKAVGVIYTPPISGDMSIQLFAYDDKAISDQTITLMGCAISNTDVGCRLMVYGYEGGYVLSIVASGHRLDDVIIGQQGVFSEDIILAVDNSNIRVYANGDFKGDIDTSGYNITLDTIVLTGDAKVTSLFRVFNKALTAEEVATLHNNGNPDAYVLPASMKQGDQRCVLEWLPANIIPDKNNTSTASEWLDTATVLPEDNVQPKITQSVGGYDGTFQGNPTIVY